MRKSRQMPVVLLVPNSRNQTAKVTLNFSQVVKSIMLLAYLGQKKGSKHLKDVAKEVQSPVRIAAGLGRTREKQIILRAKQMKIIRQATKALEATTPVEITLKNSAKNSNRSGSRKRSQRIADPSPRSQKSQRSVDQNNSGDQNSSQST